MKEKEAKLEGFYESHEILFDAIKRLKTSLNDYASIEYQDFVPPEGDKIAFAYNTLTALEDLFIDAYDQKIEPLRWEIEND